MPKLTSSRVDKILTDCLFRNDELLANFTIDDLPAGYVLSKGILNTYAFHPGRLASHRAEIVELLDELPLVFQPIGKGGGGGSSFLGAAIDKHEELWGQHDNMERLLCLGQAVGMVEWLRHPVLMKGTGLPWVRILVDNETEKT